MRSWFRFLFKNWALIIPNWGGCGRPFGFMQVSVCRSFSVSLYWDFKKLAIKQLNMLRKISFSQLSVLNQYSRQLQRFDGFVSSSGVQSITGDCLVQQVNLRLALFEHRGGLGLLCLASRYTSGLFELRGGFFLSLVQLNSSLFSYKFAFFKEHDLALISFFSLGGGTSQLRFEGMFTLRWFESK